MELEGEDPYFVGFPIILLLKEGCEFSIQADNGESVQPAALRLLRETGILRSDLNSMDLAMFPEVQG